MCNLIYINSKKKKGKRHKKKKLKIHGAKREEIRDLILTFKAEKPARDYETTELLGGL